MKKWHISIHNNAGLLFSGFCWSLMHLNKMTIIRIYFYALYFYSYFSYKYIVKIFIFSVVNTVCTHCLGTTDLNVVVHLSFKICKGNLRRPEFSLRNPEKAFNDSWHTISQLKTQATGSYSSRIVCQACHSFRFALLKHLIKETGWQDRTEIFLTKWFVLCLNRSLCWYFEFCTCSFKKLK